LYNYQEDNRKLSMINIDLREENERLKERLQDWQDQVKAVMSEECSESDNRKHCTCVFPLRKGIAELRKDVEKLSAECLRYDRAWCSHDKCENLNCDRNQQNIPKDNTLPVSTMNFPKCAIFKQWKNEKTFLATDVTATFDGIEIKGCIDTGEIKMEKHDK